MPGALQHALEVFGLAQKRPAASVGHGIGPARQSVPLPTPVVRQLGTGSQPLTKSGQCGMGRLVVAGFLLQKGVEASLVRLSHVTLDRASKTVVWRLPRPKTAPEVLDKMRAWGCVCAAGSPDPCPCHALASGHVVEKWTVAESFEAVARLVGLPTTTAFSRPPCNSGCSGRQHVGVIWRRRKTVCGRMM